MKVGFIGTGNMGNSIMEGLIKSGTVEVKNINIYDLDTNKLVEIKGKYDVNIFENEIDIVEKSDVVILSVKPNVYEYVLKKVKDKIDNKKIILTIAAGVSIDFVENIIGNDKKIVRTMPNTPAQILQGMTAYTFNKNIEYEDKTEIIRLLDSFGKSIEIEEKLMHTFVGISGSLPAYIYILIEALSDGAVLEGMPRDKSYEIISQAIVGTAKMVLETKKHPGQLKDEVTSPAGTTIEAIKVLENNNFRGTLINTVFACVEKSKKMSKN